MGATARPLKLDRIFVLETGNGVLNMEESFLLAKPMLEGAGTHPTALRQQDSRKVLCEARYSTVPLQRQPCPPPPLLWNYRRFMMIVVPRELAEMCAVPHELCMQPMGPDCSTILPRCKSFCLRFSLHHTLHQRTTQPWSKGIQTCTYR